LCRRYGESGEGMAPSALFKATEGALPCRNNIVILKRAGASPWGCRARRRRGGGERGVAAMGPRHVGFGPGVIDEDQAGRIKPPLILSPLRPPPGDVRTILFAGLQAFFEADALVLEEVPHREVAALIPRAASSAPSARNVMSGFSANRARSQSRSPASAYGRRPPTL